MKKIKRLSFWSWMTLAASVVCFALALMWSYRDRSPPGWDQGLYLYQATLLHQQLDNGFAAFVSALFNVDRGRVPLLIVLVQLLFSWFGPSLDAAVAVVNLSWFVIAWALFGTSREIFGGRFGERAGFFAFCLFASYPLTRFLSQNFLVELPLIGFVSGAIYALIRVVRTASVGWSAVVGLLLGAGVLTKVTYPFLLVLPSLAAAFVVWRRHGARSAGVVLSGAVGIPLLIAGPYYLHNHREIAGLSMWLSSNTLSRVYGFGEALSWTTIIGYWRNVFLHPVMLVCVLNIAMAILSTTLRGRRVDSPRTFSKTAAGLLLLCFPIPFLLSSFGEIKDPRYLYPGLLPLFVASGACLAYNVSQKYVRLLAVLSLFLILPGWAYGNGWMERATSARLMALAGFDINLMPDAPPDARDWKTAELIDAIDANLDHDGTPKQIFVLGGNRYFHLRLLDFHTVVSGKKLGYNALPYYEKPEMTLADALRFVDAAAPNAILYKTGENWPPFTARLDKDILRELEGRPDFQLLDTHVMQPDGSRFFLLKRTR